MTRDRETESPSLKLPLLTTPNTMNYQSSSSLSNFNDLVYPNYDLMTTPLTASVPFKWEQAPGKPIISPTQITKTPSCDTLELPPRLQMTKRDEGHFGKYTVGEMVRGERVERRRKGLFGSWGGSVNKEVFGGSFVFPADYGGEDGGGFKRVRRNTSFSNLGEIKSRFWVNMYEGLKQVIPWRSKKLKKQGQRV